MKPTVSENQLFNLVRKLFQTENQDMCKVSEDGFSVPAVLRGSDPVGRRNRDVSSYKPTEIMTSHDQFVEIVKL